MNGPTDPLLDRLFAAARESSPRDLSRLEYGFETRMMARLREERATSVFTWAWRLCPFFAALAVAAALWCWSTSARTQTEATVVAEATRAADEQMLVAYMTGDFR